MRAGTIVALLAAILLFAAFGWRLFQALALTFLVVLLLALAAVTVGIWVIKRRMERRMQELAAAVGEQLRARRDLGDDAGAGPRPGSIDAEGRVVRRPRDGADAPEDGLEGPR